MILRILLLVGAVAVTAPLHAETLSEPAPEAGPATNLSQHEVVEGDTLDAILSRAGIAAETRNEAALAISGVFDLSTLIPGQVLRWRVSEDDPARLDHLSLLVKNGTDIVLDFSKPLEAALVDTQIQIRNRRESFMLVSSLYDALAEREAPESFAVDLAALLAGQVDFRRDLKGGERVALIWQETALPDGTIMGEPQLSYARLELSGHTYEMVAGPPDEPAILFKDGTRVQHSARPVIGARLSSVFGKRKHPVLGVERMHTGVDYAAKIGTPVRATGAGTVIFAGGMRGYGRTIDIDHGGGVVTRYAHLSRFAPGIKRGTQVSANDTIGDVGATGLVSGPNLHYEVRVDGQPTDPTEKSLASEATEIKTGDLLMLAAARVATGFFIRTTTENRG
ncbi:MULTISPECIES: M23 family metallopeptidase [Paracoccus]|uniref:M23 family metallopeptidase n=1 Tax=Paracoccus TaxID=265 RepID=UPI00223EE4EA|nr:M23 family metallopeptidase [Paracoccus beibuensis]